MSKKRREDRSSTGDASATTSPFAGLAGLRDALPAGPALGASLDERERSEASAGTSGLGKVVVRRERKGHGGKTVVVIERAALDDDDVRALKRDLGAGARREDDGAVVVQGDIADRVVDWLSARGAKVVRGS